MTRTKQDKVPARALTSEEIQKVMGSFSGRHATRNRTLFILMIRTGFRISEALSLRLNDVFQHGQVVDKITVIKSNMKGKKNSRSVLLHREAKEALADYIATSQLEFGRLFDVTRVQAWRIIDEAYKVAKIAAPHGTHASRKTFATSMYKKLNNDIFLTAQVMGHKSVNSTAAYLSVDEARLSAAVLSEE